MQELYNDFNFFTIIDILSIATAFMLGLLFITGKSRNNIANLFLGLFLWSLATEVLASFLEGFVDEDFYIFSTGLLTLPLLFLYIIKTLNYKFKPVYSIVFIPFLLEFLGVIPEQVFYIFNILLLLFMLKIIKNHDKKLGDFYSDIHNRTLSWIKMIVYIYLFFHLFWVFEELIGLVFEDAIQYFAMTSTFLTLVMIYWIGYNGFSQPEIFNAAIITSEEKNDSEIKEEIKPKISEEQNSTIEKEVDLNTTKSQFENVVNTITKDKLFLNTDIDLRTLSNQLNLKEKELSKLINTHTKKNFYHFINQFRVEEFKNLLQTPKANQLTLLGLASESGFASKSTFYSVFKTVEGMTPKQYQQQSKKSE